MNGKLVMEAYASCWIYMAVAYFLVAVSMGIYMGASGDHSLHSVHAHVNLLGWVSMAITGMIYHHIDNAGRSALASVHFWLYNVALAPMMLCLAIMFKGNPGLEPVVGMLSIAVGISIVIFAFNLYTKRS